MYICIAKEYAYYIVIKILIAWHAHLDELDFIWHISWYLWVKFTHHELFSVLHEKYKMDDLPEYGTIQHLVNDEMWYNTMARHLIEIIFISILCFQLTFTQKLHHHCRKLVYGWFLYDFNSKLNIVFLLYFRKYCVG